PGLFREFPTEPPLWWDRNTERGINRCPVDEAAAASRQSTSQRRLGAIPNEWRPRLAAYRCCGPFTGRRHGGIASKAHVGGARRAPLRTTRFHATKPPNSALAQHGERNACRSLVRPLS